MFRHSRIITGLIASAALGSPALADTARFSTFNPAATDDGTVGGIRSSTLGILQNTYGGTWRIAEPGDHLRTGIDLTNGARTVRGRGRNEVVTYSPGLVARRMADFYTRTVGGRETDVRGAALDMGSASWNDGRSSDQMWKGAIASIDAVGRFSAASQFLSQDFDGHAAGNPTGTNRAILSVANTPRLTFMPATTYFQSPGQAGPTGEFSWVRSNSFSFPNASRGGSRNGYRGTATGDARYSDSLASCLPYDSLVTFQIMDADGSSYGNTHRSWMLFFEDQARNGDHNDIAVRITAVPLPTAAAAGLGMLGVMGMRRRREIPKG